MKKFFLVFFLSIKFIFANNFTPSLYITYDSISSSKYTEATFKFVDAPNHPTEFKATGNFEEKGSIRIRGNSTATAPKKPFNIKFEKKIDILGMGKVKKWVLLSNPFDPSLIRNKLIFDLASKFSFEFSPKSYFVDVWTNGVFMGNYQLAQKIEFNKNRINYDINKGDFLFERVTKRKKNGVFYFYSPLDSIRIALNEPEQPTEEQLKDLSKKLLDIETAIATKDINEYLRYVDLQTMIDYYWIEEFVNDPDLHTGSIYFTIHNGVLRGGPVWDFDLALGNTKSASKAKTTGLYARDIWWQYLFQDSLFEKIANERYLKLAPYFENMAKDNELGGNQIDSLLLYFQDSFGRNFSDSGWAYCDSNATEDADVRRLTCPYNPEPNPQFAENIEQLRQWILDRNAYLKSMAEASLTQLDSIKATLKEVLENQNFIFNAIDSIAVADSIKRADSLSNTKPQPNIIPILSRNSKPFNLDKKTHLYLKKGNRTTILQTKREGILVKGTKTQSNTSKVIIQK